ncbi:hypothetical protein [Oscillatoria sp. HE19RPO]|uniref:hypothetical protein n=1 Tax=Oscillatoria sp. HE19RPO TaxID=2954806 RepID=UPI0020C45B82|nr:hypothetical protein [Oscillatoria sp. HE19RPO]
MANYQQWNQAIASYFTSGIPWGTRVYLSVDDDILARIGGEFGLELNADNWSDDFLLAVRKKVFFEERINLQGMGGCDAKDYPPGVGFLATTVLAAYQMADDEEINDTNYFQRLKQIFRITTESGRPPGLKNGTEEPLWQEWNRWLMHQGFLPSAKPGTARRDKYINYPISQSLLRCADQDRLRRLFNEKQWKKDWDGMTLLANIRQEASRFSQHLKQLLEDRQRYEAIAEAIHEVYQQWLEYPEISVTIRNREARTRSRYLLAGLYRTEDPFFGEIDYCIYPKQQRGRQLASISVHQGDKCQPLREERPGWYFPLESPLNANELDRGARYEITDNPNLDRLILPQRDFWILIPDPDNPDAGVYASWGTPALGTAFILLCKQELLSDLQRLRDERLIEWSGEPISPFDNSDWVELDQCMVISQAWDAVFIKNSELKDALQPIVRLSMSLSGGLRVPQQNAWLEEYPPEITVFGFAPSTDLKATRIHDHHEIYSATVKTNHKISIKFPGTGDYMIEAMAGRASTERFLRILPWSELAIASPQRLEQLPLASEYRICGSIIEKFSET